ncbi:hypothetical protein SEA_KNOCKER_58 [Mycobacterium phage Knocker]|nr:hypothetical protein SEA_KNOCKER_58 [Mycobacterium phage Knocker]
MTDTTHVCICTVDQATGQIHDREIDCPIHGDHGTAFPAAPTLGELAEHMRNWRTVGVTAESAQYAMSKVWPDADPVTLPADAPMDARRERSKLLADAERAIGGDRERDYGDATAGFERIGKMWAAILGLDEVTAEQYAMCMIAVKLGRLAETPNHRDSWMDAAGYAALASEIAMTEGRYV